jgi:hypothetical protein
MADIVSSLFGLSPIREEAEMRARQRDLDLGTLYGAATVNRRGSPAQMQTYINQQGAQAALAGAGVRALGGLFGLQDPQLQRATQLESLLGETQMELGEMANDPTQFYPTLQNKLSNAGFTREAMLAGQAGQKAIQEFGLSQAKVGSEQAKQQKYQMEALSKQQDIMREEQGRMALLNLQEEAAAQGKQVTNEDIIRTMSPYVSADKLATLVQTSADKAAYRDAMIQQAQINAEARAQAAAERGATAKELAQLRIDAQKEIAQMRIDSQGGIGGTGKGRTGVYERIYNQGVLNSLNETEVAARNISVLTNQGINPLTGGALSGLQGKSLTSATGAWLGNTITDADSLQYESILEPVVYNIAQMRSGGRPPTEAQMESIRKSLLAKGKNIPHIVQLQKLGELTQIAEAAYRSYTDNPSVTEEQKTAAEQAIRGIERAIPFSGTDVAKFTIFSKKNPNVAFQDWLKVNGERKQYLNTGSGKQVRRTGTDKKTGKKVIEYTDGTREFK